MKNQNNDTEEPIQATSDNSFKHKVSEIVKNNKISTVLSFILLFVIVWFTIKLKTNENQFQKDKVLLENNYTATIDSIKTEHLTFATEVFSWSVRSELLRNNTENLNQLLTVFVKSARADLVQIVDTKDNMILLSTDKRFEGNVYNELQNKNITQTLVLTENETLKIITPIMGFNTKIGILIVEKSK